MQAVAAERRSAPGAFQIISALRHRNYRIFWFGFLISIVGVQVQTIAQGYVVYERTGSALNLGIVSGSQAAAMIIFSLAGGVVADRVERRRLLMATQVGSFCCSFTLALLVSTGAVQVWHIAAVAFVFGSFQAFDQPTRSALVPHLIEREDLMNAVALTSVVWQSSAIVGPSIAGLVIALGGISTPFFLTACGFLAFLAALAMVEVRDPEEDAGPRAGVWQDVIAGLSYIKGNGLFTALISLAFLNALFGLSFVTLLPVFALKELGLGPQGMGGLYSAMGIGALAGTLVVAALGDFPRKGLLIIGGACLFGLLLIAFSLSTWLTLSLAILVVIGVVRSLYMTSSMTVLQIRLQDRFRGRVIAVYGLQWSLMPLGGLQAGLIAETLGAPAAVAIGGAAVICFSLLVAALQPEFRRQLQPVQ
jgi:MFS family permease